MAVDADGHETYQGQDRTSPKQRRRSLKAGWEDDQAAGTLASAQLWGAHDGCAGHVRGYSTW